MIKYERRLDILRQRKIIWRRAPTTDIPTEIHEWGCYYKDGTYQNFALFQQPNKISTVNMFNWHLRVLWYLNPDLDKIQFESLCTFMADVKNGFVLHTFKEKALAYIIESVYESDLEKPPQNAPRKIVFKEFNGLTAKQKQIISGKYARLGVGVTSEDIYEEMLKMNQERIKITIIGLATNLKCTKRTIHRNLNEILRDEKKELNNNLKDEKL